MKIAVCALSAVLLSGCSWLGLGGNQTGLIGHGASAGCSGSSVYGQGSNYGQSAGYGQAYGYGTSGCAGANGYQVAGYGAGGSAYGAGGSGYGMGGAGSYGQGGGAGYGNGHGTGYGVGGHGVHGAGHGAGFGAGNGTGYGAGSGTGYGSGYGAAGGLRGAYGSAGTGFGANGAYGNTGFGTYGAGFGGAGSSGAGYGATGYGAAGSGVTGYGATGYGATGYGAGTVLNGSAPYGSAVGGGYGVNGLGGAGLGGQFVNGQWVSSSSSYTGGANGLVQTVQGAPIYVQQPYPQYYGVGYNAGGYSSGGFGYGLRGANRGLPFGIELGYGTEFDIGGDIVGAKPAGDAFKGGANPLTVSATDAISYKDAYHKSENIDLAATYDISPQTTLLGRIGYSDANGRTLQTGTLSDGTLTEDLFAKWGDLEQTTVEAGIRQYVGGWNNRFTGMRPYVGATAGMTHNNDVHLSQYSETLMPIGSNVQNYIQEGWQPTLSGVVGAEMQVGGRAAIGVETGIRWRDNMKSIQPLEDRWSVPLSLRGRVSF